MASVHQFGSEGEHDRYDVLLDVADLIVLHLSVPELLKALSERLHRVVPFELANLSLHDASSSVMHVHIWEGNEVAIATELPVDESPSGWVWRNQLPLVVPDLEAETRFAKVFQGLIEKGLKSY